MLEEAPLEATLDAALEEAVLEEAALEDEVLEDEVLEDEVLEDVGDPPCEDARDCEEDDDGDEFGVVLRSSRLFPRAFAGGGVNGENGGATGEFGEVGGLIRE